MDEQHCRWHHRRPALAMCVACSSRLCQECTVHTRVGVKCRSCAGVALAGPGRRLATLIASSLAAIAVAAVLVVLVVRSHDSGQGPVQPASIPAPSASTPPSPLTTPIPCSLDHQDMC